MQLRRQAIDLVSDALLKAPRNEPKLKPRPGHNQDRPRGRAAYPELTAIATREKLLVSDAHTERQEASLSDQAADEISSDAQTSGGQPTATPLADSTAAAKATAHDDSMTNVDAMYEKLHQPSTYRGRSISQSNPFWPRTDFLSSSHQPGSPGCTPTKPNLHCDTVTDADLADEAFQSSPESMHEQAESFSTLGQPPGFPFCWGAASPVERKKKQVQCIEHSFLCSLCPFSNCFFIVKPNVLAIARMSIHFFRKLFSYSLTHARTHSVARSLTHSLTHPPTH